MKITTDIFFLELANKIKPKLMRGRKKINKQTNLHCVQGCTEELMLDLVSAQIVWGDNRSATLTGVI